MKKDLLLLMTAAMDNAREGITISDPTLPDNPLIYVNDGFLKISGYSKEEIIEKNCRYLQGAETEPEKIEIIRDAICRKKEVQLEIMNYRKNGEAFWNRLSIIPVFDEKGAVTNFIGVQDDITLQKEKESIELKIERQKLINETTLQVQEKQRKELGAELHDNINQLLATTRLYLKMAIENNDQRVEFIKQSKQIVDTTIEEIRKLSKSLVSPKFHEMSLNESLCDMVHDLLPVAPFKINYTCHTFDESILSLEKKIMLFRITQEQLNNAIKHSHANNVWINMEEKNNSVLLIIKDDGNGFDAAEKAGGIGLKNIRSRIEFENGTMLIKTAPGKGCEMIIDLPV